MLSLPDSQRRLQTQILGDGPPAGEGLLRAGSRPEIYHHAYRARLAGALRINFPVLAALLGDEAFDRLALAYARRRPSRHFSIRWHGDDFASEVPSAPLADIARMDWALGLAFDAADRQPLTAADLAAVDPQAWSCLPLALHPSVVVVPMAWAVEPVWEAARAGQPELPARWTPDAHALIAWRHDLQAHWRIATEAEGRSLGRLGVAGTLEGACENGDEEDAGRIGAWFASWVQTGLLVPGRLAPS